VDESLSSGALEAPLLFSALSKMEKDPGRRIELGVGIDARLQGKALIFSYFDHVFSEVYDI